MEKTIKRILMAAAIILAIALAGTSIRSCSLRRNDRNRAEREAARAREFETKYAETDQLLREALDAVGRTELELGNIRASHRRLEEIRGELDAEVERLGAAIIDLEKLHGELTVGIGGAADLVGAIEAEARGAIDIVERLQAGDAGPNP